MNVAIKLEGIEDARKFFREYTMKVIPAAEVGIKKAMNIVLIAAQSKIRNISGETAASLAARLDGKGNSYVVGHIGTLGQSKNAAIRANSLEYGHAFPNQGIDSLRAERKARILAGEIFKRKKGVRMTDKIKKSVPAYPFIRPALDETKGAVKKILQAEIERAIKGK